eukprot:2185044-Prymnesium_polylepis.1
MRPPNAPPERAPRTRPPKAPAERALRRALAAQPRRCAAQAREVPRSRPRAPAHAARARTGVGLCTALHGAAATLACCATLCTASRHVPATFVRQAADAALWATKGRSANAWFRRGLALLAMGEFNEAAADLDAAKRLEPTHAGVRA